jgi:hypothetical protein
VAVAVVAVVAAAVAVAVAMVAVAEAALDRAATSLMFFTKLLSTASYISVSFCERLVTTPMFRRSFVINNRNGQVPRATVIKKAASLKDNEN